MPTKVLPLEFHDKIHYKESHIYNRMLNALTDAAETVKTADARLAEICLERHNEIRISPTAAANRALMDADLPTILEVTKLIAKRNEAKLLTDVFVQIFGHYYKKEFNTDDVMQFVPGYTESMERAKKMREAYASSKSFLSQLKESLNAVFEEQAKIKEENQTGT